MVLFAIACLLVLDQRIPAEKGDRLPVKFPCNAGVPIIIEPNAGDRSEQVDAVWRSSKLYDPLWRRQILGFEGQATEPKRGKASITRQAFSRVGRRKKSMSPVKRG